MLITTTRRLGGTGNAVTVQLNNELQQEPAGGGKGDKEGEGKREEYAVIELSFIIQSQNNERQLLVYIINSRPVYTATYKAHKGKASQY